MGSNVLIYFDGASSGDCELCIIIFSISNPIYTIFFIICLFSMFDYCVIIRCSIILLIWFGCGYHSFSISFAWLGPRSVKIVFGKHDFAALIGNIEKKIGKKTNQLFNCRERNELTHSLIYWITSFTLSCITMRSSSKQDALAAISEESEISSMRQN